VEMPAAAASGEWYRPSRCRCVSALHLHESMHDVLVHPLSDKMMHL